MNRSEIDQKFLDEITESRYPRMADERPPLRIDIAGVGAPPSMPEDVGPAPDDLTALATQMTVGTQAAESIALPMPTDGAPSMTSYNPTTRERLAEFLQAGFESVGMERFQARRQAQSLVGGPSSNLPLQLGVADIVPFLGTGLQTEEAGKMLGDAANLAQQGDFSGAAINATIGALGLIPGAAGTVQVARKVGGEIAREMATTPPRGSVQIRPTPVQTPTPVQAPRSGLGFYSAVEETVANLPQAKGSGQQFLAQIQKTSGVKPDEIKWTGLDEFLKGKKSVTKTEIQEYLNANRVDVQEVRLGGQQDFDLTRLSQLEDEFAMLRQHPIDDPNFGEDKYDEMIRLMNIRDQSTTSDLYRQADDAMMYGQRAQARGDQRSAENFFRQYELLNTRAEKLDLQGLGMTNLPKFSQYKLPGGENYREILLTLPVKERVVETQVAAGKKPVIFENKTTGQFELLDSMGEPRAFLNTRAEAEKAADEIAAPFVKSETVRDPEFYSPHFDQPNVLAHMRVNDRTVDGKKTLFIEEIQSDWHQEGRKKGYVETGKPFEVFNPRDGNVVSRFATEKEAKEYAKQLGPQMDYARSEGALDAPFKTTWHELTLKRAIQEASENGYDQIAFTTGKTQAERYDLSKQVNSLLVMRKGDGNYSLGIKQTDADESFKPLELDVPESELSNYIGKDLSQKITKDVAGSKNFSKVYSGLDLQIGGEGMKGFYDNILPKSLDKLGKKFDAKVGKTQMDGVEVWQMDITPKMRKSVTTKGQPLFAVPAAAAAGAATMQQPEERM